MKTFLHFPGKNHPKACNLKPLKITNKIQYKGKLYCILCVTTHVNTCTMYQEAWVKEKINNTKTIDEIRAERQVLPALKGE